MKRVVDRILRHRNLLLFVAAVALAALAAFGARGYISEQVAIERERLRPRQQMTQVVVAKRDLPKGEIVSADTMAVREVPKEYLPASAITPERFDGFAGTRLASPMRAGEPLLSNALDGADPSTFSAKVRSGIRAITIAVDEVNSLSGMLQPGDRIDLMLSIRMPAGAATPLAHEVTRPLMQDLRVLATGRQVRPGADERAARPYTAITVEVSPSQAQQLIVAQRSGKLTAMLRNPEDRAPIEQRSMDVYGLLELQPSAPRASPPLPPEIIVGGQGALRPLARAGATAGTHPVVPPAAGDVTAPGAAGVKASDADSSAKAPSWPALNAASVQRAANGPIPQRPHSTAQDAAHPH